jgi:hypothetical protein
MQTLTAQNTYRGSESERSELLQLYTTWRGDMETVRCVLPCGVVAQRVA